MAEFGDADVERVLGRLTVLISDLPGVSVEASHGHTAYLLRKKRFVWLLRDHHGDGRLALWIKATKDEQESLVAADPARYFVPPYLGPSGWVGADVDPASQPDWDMIADLVEQAWRMGATKKALAEFDARDVRDAAGR